MVNAMKLTAPIGASPRGDILARGRIQSRYVYCDGEHELLLTTPEITAAHAEAIERADAEFALVIEEPAILLCAGSAIRSPGRPPRSAGTPCRAACASVAPGPPLARGAEGVTPGDPGRVGDPPPACRPGASRSGSTSPAPCTRRSGTQARKNLRPQRAREGAVPASAPSSDGRVAGRLDAGPLCRQPLIGNRLGRGLGSTSAFLQSSIVRKSLEKTRLSQGDRVVLNSRSHAPRGNAWDAPRPSAVSPDDAERPKRIPTRSVGTRGIRPESARFPCDSLRKPGNFETVARLPGPIRGSCGGNRKNQLRTRSMTTSWLPTRRTARSQA